MRVRQPAHRFLGGEPWSAAVRHQVVVVGIPNDAGSVAPSAAKNGPGQLRRVTAAMSPPGHRREEGWYDFATGRSLLAGVRLADFGDLVLDPMSLREDLHAVPDVLGELRASCDLLVVLGGDDSLAYWACRRSGADLLVHLDAHEDASGLAGQEPRHGNFVSFLERDEPALDILQFGQRDLVPGLPRTPGPRRRLCRSVDVLREEIEARPPEEIALSIDIDVLDPRVMPSVTNPIPNGLRPEELVAVAETVASGAGRVRQLTLTEFAPVDATAMLDSVIVARVLMGAIDACLR